MIIESSSRRNLGSLGLKIKNKEFNQSINQSNKQQQQQQQQIQRCYSKT